MPADTETANASIARPMAMIKSTYACTAPVLLLYVVSGPFVT
ncbi:hypothetical protein [Methanogenium sp. MK-MG]|nr:hypothetical protein [Methanogenium sp. MK-MG]